MAIAAYLRELLKEAMGHPGKSSACNSDGLSEAWTSPFVFLYSTQPCGLEVGLRATLEANA